MKILKSQTSKENKMKPNIEKLKNIPDSTMYTYEEVAGLLNMSTAGVRSWAYKGKMKNVRVGGRFYIMGVELKKMIEV